MTGDEQRGYSKGYAAGQKRADREYSRALHDHRREEFKRDVFLAVLPQLMAAPWRNGDQPWSTREQFIKGAWGFAEEAAKGTTFSGEQP